MKYVCRVCGGEFGTEISTVQMMRHIYEKHPNELAQLEQTKEDVSTDEILYTFYSLALGH